MTQHFLQLHTDVTWYGTSSAHKSIVLEQNNYLHAYVSWHGTKKGAIPRHKGLQREQEKNSPIDWMKEQVLDVTQ